MSQTAEVVICGAGIAGISAAYHLAVNHGVRDIALIDQRSPLSLTSDKSTECYRNWWPGPGEAMVSLMNRSIDIMDHLAEESGNAFNLNRRGYLYLTGDETHIDQFVQWSHEPSRLGAGPLRIHDDNQENTYYSPTINGKLRNHVNGADLLLNPNLIRENFPFLGDNVIAGLHVRRAGWVSAQQMGMYLLNRAQDSGVRLVRARIIDLETSAGRVEGVILENGILLTTRNFVAAPGPLLNQVTNMLGVDLPVFNELHLKVAFNDHKQVLPREAPMLIWSDPQHLSWSPEEREILMEYPQDRTLLEEMPSGAHTRPEGGHGSTTNLMLWEYHNPTMEPVWPIPIDPQYPETVLRGLSRMIPGLKIYFNRSTRPFVDGGYYTKTQENRPLIGPLPISGAYVIGALSGFGIMAALGAGDLLADHLTGSPLPHYAPAFHLDRYKDPDYQRMLYGWEDSGQL